MYLISVPETFKDRQRCIEWRGTESVFDEVCRDLVAMGFDLKRTFRVPNNKIIRYVWLPRQGHNLSFDALESAIEAVIRRRNTTPVRSAAQIDLQTWLAGFQMWVGTIAAPKEQAALPPLFEIDQWIALGDFAKAENYLERSRALEVDARRMSNIIRSQMFLKHRQQQHKRVWELYLEWRERKLTSPDPLMAYWTARGAYAAKEYREAYTLLKELRNHSPETLNIRERLDLNLLLVELHNRFEDYVESLLLAGYLFPRETLSVDERDMLERSVFKAVETLIDRGEWKPEYGEVLPTTLRDELTESFDLSSDDELPAVVPEPVQAIDVDALIQYWEMISRDQACTAVFEMEKYTEHPRVRLALARTYAEALTDYEKSEAWLSDLDEELIADEDQLTYARIKLLIAVNAGREDEGLHWGAAYIRASKRPDPQICAVYGKLLSRSDGGKALLYLKMALEQGLRTAELHHDIGMLLVSKEDYKEAAQHFQEALHLDPTHEESLQWLFEAETDESVKLKAAESYVHSLKKDEWRPELRKLYNDRLNLARGVDTTERKEALFEAYQDMLEFEIRQEPIIIGNVSNLFDRALRELPDTTAFLDFLSTVEIVNTKSGDAFLAEAYLKLIFECMRKETEFRYIPALLKNLILLGEVDLARELREEWHKKVQSLKMVDPDQTSAEAFEEAIDLSHLRVVIVSGYEHVRKRIRERLEERFAIHNWGDVPPAFEASYDAGMVKEQIRNANVILFMYRCSKHSDSYSLEAAIQAIGPIPILYVNGKGHSSALAVFENYVIEHHRPSH